MDVWNGVSEFREENSPYRCGQPDTKDRKKRGKITQRPRKSRVRQLKHFMKLPTLPEMFSVAGDDAAVRKADSQEDRADFDDEAMR